MRLMPSFLIGLALAALTSTAMANTPAAALPTAMATAPAVTSASSPVAVAPAVAPGCTAPGCAAPTKHICVPEVAPITTTHTCYRVKCVHICLPNCNTPGGCKKDCGKG